MDSIMTKFTEYLTEMTISFKENLEEISQNLTILHKILPPEMEKKLCHLEAQELFRLIKSHPDIFDKLIDACSNDYYFFGDFAFLSEFLVGTPFNTRERLQIVFGFIKKDISSNFICKNISSFNFEELPKYSFQTISKQELKKLNETNKLQTFLNTNSKKLSRKQRKQQRELRKFIDENKTNLSVYVTPMLTIKECYFDKTDGYDEDEVVKIIEALKDLGISDPMCQSFKAVLMKDLQKRKAKVTIPITHSVLPKATPSKTYLTNQEYKNILKETKTYFDLYRMQQTRPLTEEEMYYCASLYIKLGISKDEVCSFFRAVARDKKMDPYSSIAEFANLYDKLTYYAQKCNIQENIQTILEYLKETFITTDESYKFWKESVRDELYKILSVLPDDFAYEYEHAQELSGVTYKKD